MRSLLTAILATLCIGLFSCQKEVDDIFSNSGNNGGGGNTSGLLTKMVIKDGSDSSVTTYSYNSANKIVGINAVTVESGATSVTNNTVVRNAQGIIQKIISKSSDLTQFGIDSVVSIVNYNTSSQHYTSRVLKVSFFGISFGDSSSFVYDASGKIVTEFDFLDDGTGTSQNSKFDFTYSGSNMASMKGYDMSSGTPDLQITELFEYDAKFSPLTLGNEAFILNNAFEWLSVNNISRQTVNLVGDPTTYLITHTYIYNSSNRPVSATIINDGQPSGTVNYYYK